VYYFFVGLKNFRKAADRQCGRIHGKERSQVLEIATAMQFDRELALSRVGGDEELLKEIAALFLEDYPRTLEEISLAIQQRDSHAIERSAHGLKGSVANFGAAQAVKAASAIENMGRNAQIEEAAMALKALELALAALHLQLEAL